MVFKIIGVVLILSSSCAIGFRLSSDLGKRIEDLKSLKKIILMLRGEIKYNNSTLAEAFEVIGSRIKEPYRIFFQSTGTELNKLSGQTFFEIWKEMIYIHLEPTKLLEKDKKRLESIGENLGYLDKEMQLGTIDLYLEHLELEIEEAHKNLNNNGRLYKCLGIMGGILITLIIV